MPRKYTAADREKRRARYLARREECIANARAYNSAHSEDIREKRRAYRVANREKLRAYYVANREKWRAYYVANREKLKAYARDHARIYAAAHREECKSRSREYYYANKEKVRARQNAYYAANRERRKSAVAKCRRNMRRMRIAMLVADLHSTPKA